jgi:hypothetical protein
MANEQEVVPTSFLGRTSQQRPDTTEANRLTLRFESPCRRQPRLRKLHGFLPQENATGKGRLNLPLEGLQIDELAAENWASSS